MSISIRRRRFGQLALASAAATALANLAGKAIAQESPLPILGVRLSRDTTVTDTDLANTTPAVVVVSSELATGNKLSRTKITATTVDNLIDTANLPNQPVSIQPRERLIGFTSLSDGTLIIASTVNSMQGNFSHLLFTDTQSSQSPKSLTVSGLPNRNSTVESLLATHDDTLVAVVSLNAGTPPFKLVTIDRNSGIVNHSDNLGLPQLPPFQRLSNLALCGDETIYGTTLGPQGVTVLVQLDLNNNTVISLSPLTFNNKPLQNDLRSLAFSPSNQLLALADLNRQGTNALYCLDVKTGEIKQLRQFAVDQITFARY